MRGGRIRARAQLPDFFGLASQVVARLGVDQNSPAYRLIQEAREIDHRVGIPGVISADRVFGLLERDFASRDIEEAVASALKPPANCDLTAHRILLDLATTPEGTVQLVTTNFDRLFDDCGRNLRVWQPPRLPNPSLPNEINGIVYLHGRSTPTYTAAENDGFVLSSSEFGRAYLSDGWATTFIREILGKYIVVFVGYTADDPPVQYLLEALRKTSGNRENAYAFQSGDHDDAIARWRHKGVEAIPYSPDDAHATLWQSLDAWAERARNPDAWLTKVIETSKKGPTALQPHERGQVTHVISTYEGVKRFCEGEVLPLLNGFVCSINTDDSQGRLIQSHLVAKKPMLIHSINMALIQTPFRLNQILKIITPSEKHHPMRGMLSNLIILIKQRSAMKILLRFAVIGLIIYHVLFRA